MKELIIIVISFITFSLNAQVDIANLDTVLINEFDSPQYVSLNVQNISSENIDLDWEIEFASNVEAFIQIAVSDINIHYTPQVHTSCDLSGITNILEPSESDLMGLDFTFDEVPSFIDKNSPIAFFKLYLADNCNDENLLSIPIMFNSVTTSSIDINKHKKINLYPNPSDRFLFLTYDEANPKISFKIFDIQLKQIMSGVVENGVIDISTLVPGQYVLRVDDQNLLFLKK